LGEHHADIASRRLETGGSDIELVRNTRDFFDRLLVNRNHFNARGVPRYLSGRLSVLRPFICCLNQGPIVLSTQFPFF
jgi:hypothetical protein